MLQGRAVHLLLCDCTDAMVILQRRAYSCHRKPQTEQGQEICVRPAGPRGLGKEFELSPQLELAGLASLLS